MARERKHRSQPVCPLKLVLRDSQLAGIPPLPQSSARRYSTQNTQDEGASIYRQKRLGQVNLTDADFG
jgi:hypothetical protein